MNQATHTVILTRPQPGADRFADLLRARFDEIRIVVSPLQEIEFRDPTPLSEEPNGLIFSSQNGVLGWSRLEKRPHAIAYCVGPQTTQKAKEFGPNAINCGGDAEAVVETILSLRPSGPLVHFRGEHGRGQIAKRLSEAGVLTTESVVYCQKSLPPSPELIDALGQPDAVVPLFSPRSAKLLAAILPPNATPRLAVISQATADQLDPGLRHRMMVAKTPDSEGMLNAISACLSAKRQP